ncbi:hypothetical protein ACHAPJ_009391 [Fusarium lateritium]
MSPADHNKQKKKAKSSQEPVMLQAWLNEPEDITSASDVWSSQRALTQPRQYVDSDKSHQPKDESGGAAEAA